MGKNDGLVANLKDHLKKLKNKKHKKKKESVIDKLKRNPQLIQIRKGAEEEKKDGDTTAPEFEPVTI